MLMIFDLLTSPQGHQFDPRMKKLLEFCSARHPCRLICHMTMFEKKKIYVLYLSFVRTHTKFGIKIFEIDFVIEIK